MGTPMDPTAASEARAQAPASAVTGTPPGALDTAEDPGFLFPRNADEEAADGCDATGDLPTTQLEEVNLTQPELA
eukprot:12084467-Alexandrium_andersonii.AAC.1